MSNSSKFDRTRIATPHHPKSIVNASLFQSLTQYAAVTQDTTQKSAQCHAIELKYKLSFNLIQPGTPPSVDGKDAIELIEQIRINDTDTYDHPTPDYVHIDPVTLNNVQCYWIYDDAMHKWQDGPFLVFYHGGGYIFGSVYTYSGIAYSIAHEFNMPLLFVEYTPAPDALFPTQGEQTVAVHKALLELDSKCYNRMITYGDSAGGALSVIHNQQVIAHKLPAPALCIAISGYFDTLCTGESYEYNWPVEHLFSKQECQWWLAQCVGGKAHNDKLKSTIMNPLQSTFKGFNSTYIAVGGAEVLLSDSEQCYKQMQADHVDVELLVAPNMFHSWINYCNKLPEAQRDIKTIVAWTRRKLNEQNKVVN